MLRMSLIHPWPLSLLRCFSSRCACRRSFFLPVTLSFQCTLKKILASSMLVTTLPVHRSYLIHPAWSTDETCRRGKSLAGRPSSLGLCPRCNSAILGARVRRQASIGQAPSTSSSHHGRHRPGDRGRSCRICPSPRERVRYQS